MCEKILITRPIFKEVVMKKTLPGLLLLSFFSLASIAGAEDLKVTFTGGDATATYQYLEENKILLSVKDSQGNPIKGIIPQDLQLTSGLKRAKIISVEPLEINKEVPLNLFMVFDNSYSMKQRQAVEPLLSALKEFFGLLRPIDDVYLVIFSNKSEMALDGRPLHVKTFRSNDKNALMNFIKAGYGKGLTDSTYLYEALAAGINLAGEASEKQNKFLMVFSDGEDINSKMGKEDVFRMLEESAELSAFAVDYMPQESTDPFLTDLTGRLGGSIWKARSAAELVPIFKAFSSTLLQRYVVNYRLSDPPTGELSVEPAKIELEALTLLDGTLLPLYVFFGPGKSDLPSMYKVFPTKAHTAFFDEKAIKNLKDRHLNTLNIVGSLLRKNPSYSLRIVGCTSGEKYEKGMESLSLARAEAIRAYLKDIWEIDPARLRIEARGLPQNPAQEVLLEGPAENQRVEITIESGGQAVAMPALSVREKNGADVLEVRPKVAAPNGISVWEISIRAKERVLATQKGTGDLQSFYLFALADLGWDQLVYLPELDARIKITDGNDDIFEAPAPVIEISSSRNEAVKNFIEAPAAAAAFEPSEITVEEITTIESSPMLNYVFFGEGQSRIPDRYILFKDRAETRSFSFDKIEGAMEKHRHLLNIMGKRLKANPQASIRVVGCNADSLEEKGRVDISRERASAVKDYLEVVWGIAPSRITIEARGLPAFPSPSRHEEGRAENRRVEILSDFPEILDSIASNYVEYVSPSKEIKVIPQMAAGYGIERWKIAINGEDGTGFTSLSGAGDQPDNLILNLKELGLKKIAAQKAIVADVELVDRKGNIYKHNAAARCNVNFTATESRKAQKIGYRVQESYALILFDFGSDKISGRNRVLSERVVGRFNSLPGAEVKIIGHTDTTGPEEVNLALSERRAKAVHSQLKKLGMKPAEAITVTGVGPYDPLYDNALPEGRALNRTVSIYIEYAAMD